MSKLTIKKRGDRNHAGKDAAIEAVMADDFLSGPVHNGRFDVDKRLHRALKNLSNVTETEAGKSVSMRMLMTEALLDLFDKYDQGEGKYPVEEGESWTWKDK